MSYIKISNRKSINKSCFKSTLGPSVKTMAQLIVMKLPQKYNKKCMQIIKLH